MTFESQFWVSDRGTGLTCLRRASAERAVHLTMHSTRDRREDKLAVLARVRRLPSGGALIVGPFRIHRYEH